MEDNEILQQAVNKWGARSQLDMVIEECAELIDAIQKWRNRRVDYVRVLEKGVDVELAVTQLKVMLNTPTLWENVRKDELARLENRLKGQE